MPHGFSWQTLTAVPSSTVRTTWCGALGSHIVWLTTVILLNFVWLTMVISLKLWMLSAMGLCWKFRLSPHNGKACHHLLRRACDAKSLPSFASRVCDLSGCFG